ncbi:MAG: hypothetical protein ACTSWL_01250, partial [Promethearchaeota archaeon]
MTKTTINLIIQLQMDAISLRQLFNLLLSFKIPILIPGIDILTLFLDEKLTQVAFQLENLYKILIQQKDYL